jgi:hypothetical protein
MELPALALTAPVNKLAQRASENETTTPRAMVARPATHICEPIDNFDDVSLVLCA